MWKNILKYVQLASLIIELWLAAWQYLCCWLHFIIRFFFLGGEKLVLKPVSYSELQRTCLDSTFPLLLLINLSVSI
jgi:hypothetical protein